MSSAHPDDGTPPTPFPMAFIMTAAVPTAS